MKDYYEILEVHPKASKEVIKKAYETLAKLYHPDETAYEKGFAREKLTELNEAYSVLSDLERREEYDGQYFGELDKQEKAEPSATEKNEPGNEVKTDPPLENKRGVSEESKKELLAEDKEEPNVAPTAEKPVEETPWYKKAGDWVVKGIVLFLMLAVGGVARYAVRSYFATPRQTASVQQGANRLSEEAFQKYTKQVAECTTKIQKYETFQAAHSSEQKGLMTSEEIDIMLGNGNYVIAKLYKERAWAYDELGEYEKAIVDYTKAVELTPIDGNTYYNRGVVYQHKGDRAKANADFAKAKELGYKPNK